MTYKTNEAPVSYEEAVRRVRVKMRGLKPMRLTTNVYGDEVLVNELDKTEWFDVARYLKPEMTWEEFTVLWDDFQEMKRKRALQ